MKFLNETIHIPNNKHKMQCNAMQNKWNGMYQMKMNNEGSCVCYKMLDMKIK